MQIDYLKNAEKYRTRPMWERIFSEDTEQFLDYYYNEKNRDNQILTLSLDGKDAAMLHLNPYRLRIGRGEAVCNYIVAVATEPDCRHRGYMARLLKEAFIHMYGQKEPFTFLMPADEAIYLPFDFRFVYDQEKMTVRGKKSERWDFRMADESDAKLLGELAQGILHDKTDAAAIRDDSYYRRQILEQKSENGGIMIAMHDSVPAGFFLFGKEDGYEIMEPLAAIRVRPDNTAAAEYEEFLRACVYSLTGDGTTEVTCRGLLYPGAESVPVIMARIIHLEAFFEMLSPVCDFRMELAVTDPVIKENEGIFRLSASRGRICAEKVRDKIETEESYSVSELVQVLFGYRGRSELATFIRPLSRVFLNEVV